MEKSDLKLGDLLLAVDDVEGDYEVDDIMEVVSLKEKFSNWYVNVRNIRTNRKFPISNLELDTALVFLCSTEQKAFVQHMEKRLESK